MSSNLLKFGVPIARAASASSISVRSQTGQCGIPPYAPPPPPPPPPTVFKIPDHLIRPPCMPDSVASGLSDCNKIQGFYCPVQRITYKFKPFSENIDFVPTGTVECWWTNAKRCDLRDDEEEELPIKLP